MAYDENHYHQLIETVNKQSEEKNIIILQQAILEIQNRLSQMQHDQDQLSDQVRDEFTESNNISGDELARKVKADLLSDVQQVFDFNDAVSKYCTENGRYKISFQIKTNKMLDIISGVQEMLGDDESVVVKLASGEYPDGYDNATNYLGIPVLGEEGEFWGNSKSTYLSQALLSIKLSLNPNASIKDMPLKSSIFHVSPLPKEFKYEACRYVQNYGDVSGFGFTHSGYAFGGHRHEESFYPGGKVFAPEDCSSWVAHITNFDGGAYSTADQWCTRYFHTVDYFKPVDWHEGLRAQNMLAQYQSQRGAPQPGDVQVMRAFNANQNAKNSIGAGGHTTLVLGNSTVEGKVVTLGFNRDMPGKEGFGIQEYDVGDVQLADNRVKRTCYLLP